MKLYMISFVYLLEAEAFDYNSTQSFTEVSLKIYSIPQTDTD